MIRGRISPAEFSKALRLSEEFKPGASLNWVLPGERGLRASLSWDGEEGVISGDLVEYGDGEAASLLRFDARWETETEQFLIEGEEVIGDTEMDARALLQTFAEQVSMIGAS